MKNEYEDTVKNERFIKRIIWVLILLAAAIIFLSVVQCWAIATVLAEDVQPESSQSEDLFKKFSSSDKTPIDLTAIHLARCLRAECGDCLADRNAYPWILWAHAKAEGRTLDEKILTYCAVFKDDPKYPRSKKSQDRVERIRASTFDEPLEGRTSWWLATAVWIQWFLDVIATDPYPLASDWNGPQRKEQDVERGFEIIGQITPESNIFYRRPKKQK
jgi:hypothetical protein